MLPTNPKEVEKLFRKIGIRMETVDAEQVVIDCGDTQIIISNPVVQKVKMHGVVSFQIQGDIEERPREKQKFSEEDVNLVMEKTRVSREQAVAALKKSGGDIAQAILSLSGD